MRSMRSSLNCCSSSTASAATGSVTAKTKAARRACMPLRCRSACFVARLLLLADASLRLLRLAAGALHRVGVTALLADGEAVRPLLRRTEVVLQEEAELVAASVSHQRFEVLVLADAVVALQLVRVLKE